MNVQLAEELLGEPYRDRAESILRKCVHCGFCNTTCPTYNLLGEELDGPRGRIYLIKGMLESNSVQDSTQVHLDRCLTCRNCETTCPSGVEYGELLEIGREFIADKKSTLNTLAKALLIVVPRFRWLRFLVRLGRFFKWLLPPSLKSKIPSLKQAQPVKSDETATVTLIQGCAQRALTPNVTQHLAKLLRNRGVGIRVVEDEVCCGGLHLHLGQSASAKSLMDKNCEVLFDKSSEVYLSSASGCGVTIKDYDRLISHQDANLLADRTKDVSEYLSAFSFKKQRYINKVAIHQPCTLQHGQKLDGLVEKILRETGYDIVDVKESHLCCGSAGSYSLLQPELSDQLRGRKLACLEAGQPEVIATANVGCELHLSQKSNIPVVHWITLLN